MELGLDFDDSDFTEKVRQKETLTSYNAKVCYPEWFFSDRADNGRNDMATVFKFRGDYHYQRKGLKSAIQCYKNSLDRLGTHNRTMRRELMESLARCHMQNDEFEMSLKYIKQVISDCLTVENYCCALMLQQQLYRCSGDLLSELSVLRQLINLHPGNAQFWLKLVDLFERIRVSCKRQKDDKSVNNAIKDDNLGTETITVDGQKDTSLKNDGSCKNCKSNPINCKQSEEYTSLVGCTHGNEQDICVNSVRSTDNLNSKNIGVATENETSKNCIEGLNETLSTYPVDMILLTCYIRARLILSSVQGTVGSFVKDRNLQLVDMLNCKIDDLKVKDSILEVVTQFIRRDTFEEDADDAESKPDQSHDIKVLMEIVVTAEDFNTRWFSWIREIP